MTFKPPKPQADPEPRPDVEVGDHLYVHHHGQPRTGKVMAHGKHGVTVDVEGRHHKVKWDKVLGHKQRIGQTYSIVDQGEDGMLVEEPGGRRRFIATPNESKEDPMVAKSMGSRPITLFLKASAPGTYAGGPGLQKKQITDKRGVQTTKWVSTDRGGPPAQRGQHVGFQNGDHKGHGEVIASGQHGVTVRDASGGRHQVEHAGQSSKVTHHWSGDGAPDGSPHGDDLEQAAAESEARREQAKKLSSGKDAVELRHSDGKRYALAGKDASKPGGYRITHFDEKGPIGHGERASLEDAVHSGLESGYKPADTPAPGTPKPQAGGAEDIARALFDTSELEKLATKVPQPVSSWEELSAKAPEALQQFTDMLGKVAQSLDLQTGKRPKSLDNAMESETKKAAEEKRSPKEVKADDYMLPEHWDSDRGFLFMGPLKGQERAEEKVRTDYNGDWSQVRDMVRATIAVPMVTQIPKVLAELKAAGIELAQKPKNNLVKPLPGGYRDLNLIVKLPNGLLAELQVHIKPMTLAKEKGHKPYETTRSIEGKYRENGVGSDTSKWDAGDREKHAAAMQEQEKLYGDAWEKAKGGEKKTPEPSSNLTKSLRAPRMILWNLKGYGNE